MQGLLFHRPLTKVVGAPLWKATTASLPLTSSNSFQHLSCISPKHVCLHGAARMQSTASSSHSTPLLPPVKQAPTSKRVNIFAAYVAPKIDLHKLAKKAVEEWKLQESQARLEKEWLIFRFMTEDYAAAPAALRHTYLSVSKTGAVVAVNVPHSRLALQAERYCLAPLLEQCASPSLLPEAYQEDLVLTLESHSELNKSSPAAGSAGAAAFAQSGEGASFSASPLSRTDVVLQGEELELDAVRILNSCMAQTVNLQHFEVQLPRYEELVEDIYASLGGGGARGAAGHSSSSSSSSRGSSKPRSMSSKQLFQSLGAVSAISNAVMLSGLRSSVRPGSSAWNEERYARMHEALWQEFELEERYEELQKKLAYITDSIKYALEVQKGSSSMRLEQAIVALISVELGLSLAKTKVFQDVLEHVMGLLQ